MSAEPGMHWLRLSETSDSSSPRFSRGRLFAGVLSSLRPRLTSSSCAFILSRVLRLTPAPASYVSLLRFSLSPILFYLAFLSGGSAPIPLRYSCTLANPRQTLLPWRIRANLSNPVFCSIFNMEALFLYVGCPQKWIKKQQWSLNRPRVQTMLPPLVVARKAVASVTYLSLIQSLS